MVPRGSARSLSLQFSRCWVASYAGSPMKRFRIDDEPRLPARLKDVPRMQVGREQHVRGRSLRQLVEETKTLAHETCIGPLLLSVSVSWHQCAVMADRGRKRWVRAACARGDAAAER